MATVNVDLEKLKMQMQAAQNKTAQLAGDKVKLDYSGKKAKKGDLVQTLVIFGVIVLVIALIYVFTR